MDHAAARRRRAAIRRAMLGGAAAKTVAARHGVSLTTVYAATRRLRVGTRHRRRVDLYRLLADLCNTDLALAELARQHGCTHQNVALIYGRCRQAGVPVRSRRVGDNQHRRGGESE